MKRHGNNCTLRKILNCNSKGKTKGAGLSNLCRTGSPSRIQNANSHSLRDIMKCNGKYHHRSFLKLRLGTFLSFIKVHMRNSLIQNQKKNHSKTKTNSCRNKGKFTAISRHIHRRNKKAPDRSGNHNTGRKARKHFLNTSIQFLFHKENQS